LEYCARIPDLALLEERHTWMVVVRNASHASRHMRARVSALLAGLSSRRSFITSSSACSCLFSSRLALLDLSPFLAPFCHRSVDLCLCCVEVLPAVFDCVSLFTASAFLLKAHRLILLLHWYTIAAALGSRCTPA
jgi:hypothetical protein